MIFELNVGLVEGIIHCFVKQLLSRFFCEATVSFTHLIKKSEELNSGHKMLGLVSDPNFQAVKEHFRLRFDQCVLLIFLVLLASSLRHL